MAIPERRKRRIRRFLDNALFFGNVIEYKDYIETARKYLHAVRRTQSTRLIVLETWLFVDYTLRQLLMHGLELTAIDQEELDLRYNLLPRSFGACIDLLVRLRKTNHQLPPKPGERALRIPGRMMD
jgi:hypothetical protein